MTAAVNQETAEVQKRYRVAVVNTHPIQYFAPLYADIHANCPEIDLEVLYLSDWSLRNAVDPGFATTVSWDIDLLKGYQYRFVGANYQTVVPEGFWSMRTMAVWKAIREGNYDLVWLHGYNHAALVLAAMAAKAAGSKLALRGDSHLLLTTPGLRRVLRNAVLSGAFRWVDCFLAVGVRNRDYYRYLGVPEHQIHNVPYAIDNDRYARAVRKPGHGVPRVLFASKLIERKDAATLILAAEILQRRGIEIALEIAGSGPQSAALKALAAERNLANVGFTGFVNQSAMPELLASADIFVLTSSWEPFGLAINEALAAGLLVVVSHDLGCSLDLVEDGMNGYRVNSGNPSELADALAKLIRERPSWPSMIESGRSKVARYSFGAAAAGLRAALQ